MRVDCRNILAALVVASFSFAAQAQENAAPAAAGQTTASESRQAPDFSLKDADGKEHKLADYKGKPIVLAWINPGTVEGDDLKAGCPYITGRVKEGSFEKLAAKLQGEGAVFLAVNSTGDNTPEASKAVSQKFNQTYPVLQDTDGKVGKAYGARTTPHLFVIGPNGSIVYEGALNDNQSPDPAKDAEAKDYVTMAVQAAKKSEAPAVAKTQPYGCSIKYKE